MTEVFRLSTLMMQAATIFLLSVINVECLDCIKCLVKHLTIVRQRNYRNDSLLTELYQYKHKF